MWLELNALLCAYLRRSRANRTLPPRIGRSLLGSPRTSTDDRLRKYSRPGPKSGVGSNLVIALVLLQSQLSHSVRVPALSVGAGEGNPPAHRDLNVQFTPFHPHIGHGTGALSSERAPDADAVHTLLSTHHLIALNTRATGRTRSPSGNTRPSSTTCLYVSATPRRSPTVRLEDGVKVGECTSQ